MSERPGFGHGVFAGFCGFIAMLQLAFVSQLCKDKGVAAGYGLTKRIEAVRGCRSIGKQDMKWNDATPNIEVDPESYEVRADGELLVCDPAESLPLTQLYQLF